MVDRVELNRCLSKAISYANAGKQADAEAWARELIRQLGLEGILR